MPPVRPMRAAGTPAAAAAREHRVEIAPASTLTMTRDADSPNSVAASRSTPPSDARPRDVDVGADAAGVEAALGQRHREAAFGAVVRRLRSGRAPTRSTSSCCSARSRARSSAGGTPRSRP